MFSMDNLTGNFQYIPSPYDLSDTHGGNERLHLQEFERIVNAVVDRKIEIALERLSSALPHLIEEKIKEAVDLAKWSEDHAFQRAMENLTDALTQDVHTVVSLGFRQGDEIFHDERFQRIVSETVMKEIKKYLKGK